MVMCIKLSWTTSHVCMLHKQTLPQLQLGSNTLKQQNQERQYKPAPSKKNLKTISSPAYFLVARYWHWNKSSFHISHSYAPLTLHSNYKTKLVLNKNINSLRSTKTEQYNSDLILFIFPPRNCRLCITSYRKDM